MSTCRHCKSELESEREKYIGCCYACRRYALLRGHWPEQDSLMGSGGRIVPESPSEENESTEPGNGEKDNPLE